MIVAGLVWMAIYSALTVSVGLATCKMLGAHTASELPLATPMDYALQHVSTLALGVGLSGM